MCRYSSVKACDSDNMVKIELVEAMPQFKLNTGASIPAVGLGTWQAEPGVVGEAVKQAIKVRSFSCVQFLSNRMGYSILDFLCKLILLAVM